MFKYLVVPLSSFWLTPSRSLSAATCGLIAAMRARP